MDCFQFVTWIIINSKFRSFMTNPYTQLYLSALAPITYTFSTKIKCYLVLIAQLN